MKKILGLVFLVIMVSLIFAEPLKVAFVYIGPAGDAGWTFEHDRGRLYLEEALGENVETQFIENVPESSEAAGVIQGYARKGFDLIFTTSFGYMDPTLEVAKKYPDTIFMHCSGYKTNENMGTYFGRMYQPRYLSGLMAGEMTEDNLIGYVAAFPIPEVIRGINAFALGVKAVNPDAKIKVVWTNTWFDPTIEKEAAISLLDLGADVIAQHQDSPAAQQAAQDYGAYCIGYDSDMNAFAPEAYLGAPIWDFGPYYTKIAESVQNGTWTNEQFWGGLDTGIVKLVISDLVPEDVKEMVLEKQEEIIDGELEPFAGPIYDNEGNLKYAEGELPTDEELLAMDWFVDNVEGNL